MTIPPASIVIADVTFNYVNTLTKKVLTNTWSDLFADIAPAFCGAITCRLRRTTDCGWSYLGSHISPTTWIDPAKFEAD
jgi:hypothetical protein